MLETVHYFFAPRLRSIELEGFVITRKEIKEYPENRDKLIGHVIQRWGKPDKVFVGEHIDSNNGAHNYYRIELEWYRGDVFMEMHCPVAVYEYGKTISLLGKLYWRILGYGIPVSLVITDDPGTKVFYPKPSSYSFYKRVGAEEAERLLKSIKYYEILGQSLKTQNSNQSVLTSY
ncbi:MAG: hypothetical protein UU48_C0047G0002 [Candidatus Uhrbacteria bacterium GW2011_GWF2_41_16]|uniref:Uncharacterized protein n=1 Tax=Candidatus Uhrbacteria bacterium GW2011_GWF2_41_16 TaxID=1618997 RepID=A0A0G0Y5Q6_9BACT|nr:MAG: hypothetical protein UU48_C0047G0002 [Candidatus Uhrbacteria bacterium GW2011_GWF2_41_16]